MDGDDAVYIEKKKKFSPYYICMVTIFSYRLLMNTIIFVSRVGLRNIGHIVKYEGL